MKKYFLLLTIFVISTFLIFAGGQKEKVPSGGKKPVEITFMTWNSGYHLKEEQELANQFMKAHPGIKVSLISVPQGYDKKVLTATAAGNTPDGLLMWNTPMYVEAGVCEDLTTYIKRDHWDMNQYHPVLKAWAEYKGGIYGLPRDYTPRVIYYNKNVFDEAGVPYPKFTGWTFDDFLKIVEKLTNHKKGAAARYGFVAVPGDTYALQGYIWANGGDLCSPDGMKASGYINSPQVVEVVKWYKKIFDISIQTTTPDAYQNLGQNEFQSGIVGMMDNGSWPINIYRKDKSLRFGIVAPPVPRKGLKPSPVIHSSTLSMFKAGKKENKDAVWEYIKYVSSPAGARFFEKARYSIGPIPRVTAQDKDFLADPYFGPIVKVGNMADHVPVFTRNPRWFKADSEFRTALEKIFISNADIQSTLDKAAKKMDKILQGKE